MIEYRSIFKYLKNNITIILLIIYSVSFINYFIYYKSFNISIFNYLGLNDLLFFCFEYVFQIILVIIIGDFAISLLFTAIFMLYEKAVLIHKKKLKFYVLSSKRNKERIRDIIDVKYDKWSIEFKITLIFLGIFSIGFLPYKLITLPAYLIYFFYLIELGAKEKMGRLFFSISTIIVIFFMIISTLFNSYHKRFEKDDYIISFQENSLCISTDKSVGNLNYLGETSTNIFLYDIESKTSKVYLKLNITNIEVQKTNGIDNIIITIKESPFFKPFIQMLNENDKNK